MPATSTGSKKSSSPAIVLASYLLLTSVYLLYLPHAEFVLDDWFQFIFYSQNQVRGWAGEIEVLRALAENTLYGTFQLYWLNFGLDSLLAWVLGYAPRVLFALALLWHAVNAWVLYRLLVRLRIAPRLAFVAGAFFVLMPASHGPLFWFFGLSYYWRTPLLLFLYWHTVAGSLEAGKLTARAAVGQALLAAAVLFTGGTPSFYLLLFGAAWMALCFFPRQRWKLAAKAVAMHWVVIAALGAAYVRLVNRVPPSHQQLVARYDLSHEFLVRNWHKFLLHLRGMSGFGHDAYYHVGPGLWQVVAAAAAVVVVWRVGRRLAPESTVHPLRVAVFAAGMAVLGYGPLVYLIGGTLRHYYTIGPYVSLLLAALAWMLPGSRRRVARAAATMALCGYFAMTTVAETEQCWTPMSRHLQAVKAGLRRLNNLAPGDLVVIPNTPSVIGTAPNFALIPNWGMHMAELVTGVKGVEFWREIVIEKGRPRLYNRGAMRDTTAAELARAHVLVGPPEGPYAVMRYWAEPHGAGLHCLKEPGCGEAPGPPGDRSAVYVAKPFEHGNIAHLHY